MQVQRTLRKWIWNVELSSLRSCSMAWRGLGGYDSKMHLNMNILK